MQNATKCRGGFQTAGVTNTAAQRAVILTPHTATIVAENKTDKYIVLSDRTYIPWKL